MIITCACGEKKFSLPDGSIPPSGRMVKCGYCDKEWKQFPVIVKESKVVQLNDPAPTKPTPNVKKVRKPKEIVKINITIINKFLFNKANII